MTDRLISLTVGTKGAEEWFRSFQDLSELANNLGNVHHYVSLSSSAMGDEEPDPIDNDLYYDENTLRKVHNELVIVLSRCGAGEHMASEDLATTIIGELQNSGILFRERR
jgi:hypothetical protein